MRVSEPMARGTGRRQRAARLIWIGLVLGLACGALSACAGSGGPKSSLRDHPHKFMKEVVHCENNGGALANTPHCRKVLKINRELF